MPNYKESNIAGTKWQRACRVTIENTLNATPKAIFVEEEVSIIEDTTTHKLVGSLSYTVDPNEMVNMVDLETNEPTETQYPVGLAQWIIYSLYWKKAQERDLAAQNKALKKEFKRNG